MREAGGAQEDEGQGQRLHAGRIAPGRRSLKGRWARPGAVTGPLLFWALLLGLPGPAAAERVGFKTADGLSIAAEWRAPRRGQPVFVLLHGLGAGRGEWKAFAARAAAAGWGSLALDMRGHGDSGGPPYTAFRGPEDWLRVEADAAAALEWLASARHVARERVVLGGASIGANLALRAAADLPRIRFVMLLSPGWNYQGVTLPDAVAAYGKPIVFAAAADDPYALKSSQEAMRIAKSPAAVFLRAAKGHGVRMLEGAENKPFAEALFKALAERAASEGVAPK
ncbi:MAG: alpha/beta fold hydrolase [Elusimicrobia bacterium]|nr:alpha/beta fold hydrolase [Elusimicrobiota bacterium]